MKSKRLEGSTNYLFLRSDLFSKLLLAIPFIVVVTLTGLNFPPIIDETAFHLPFVLRLRESLSNLRYTAQYNITTPPLPHILINLWGKIFGYSLPALRSLTAILSYIAILVFFKILKAKKSPVPLETTLALLFFPYILLNSFTIYTVNYGLSFGIFALYFYLKEPRTKKDALFASLFSTLASFSRQFYIAYPAGAILTEIYTTLKNKTPLKSRLVDIFILGLPILFLGLLFFAWKGFVSPGIKEHHPLHFSFAHLTFFFVLTGFYFSSSLLMDPPEKKWFACIIVPILLLPIFFVFPLRYVHGFELGAGEGIILRISNILTSHTSQVVGKGFLAILFLLGSAALTNSLRNFTQEKLFLTFSLFSLVAIELQTPYIWERLWTAGVPAMSIIYFSRPKKGLYFLRLWVIILMMLGGAYTGLKMQHKI